KRPAGQNAGTARPSPHCSVMEHRRQSSHSSLAWLLMLCTQISTAGVTVEIEGIDGELEDAARNSLGLQQYAERPISSSQANRLFANATDEIRIALQPYGYYDAVVEGDLQRGEKEGDYRATF